MTTAATAGSAQERDLLERARGGSEDAFRDLVEPHRRELQAHCYRMLGSVQDAEDAVQDALLRAWKALPGFEPRHSLRAWLYKIATNVCLDAIGRRPKRVLPPDYTASTDGNQTAGAPAVESVWIEPYPDEQLAVEDGYAAPEARYEQREGVELAFVAALQHLPARQRAALILREVLGFSAKEAADSLDTTPQSVNSALQRARATVDEQLPKQSQQKTLRALGDKQVRALVERFGDALQRGDIPAVVSMLAKDAAWSMPPMSSWYRGDDIPGFLELGPMSGEWRWRHLPAHANGQAAFGAYVWHEGAQAYLSFALNVVTFEGDRIKEVTSFLNRVVKGTDPEYYARFPDQDVDPNSNLAYFERFGLPDRLDD
jgi:RNA polymerase sigma-70 factor, ECF subfamily